MHEAHRHKCQRSVRWHQPDRLPAPNAPPAPTPLPAYPHVEWLSGKTRRLLSHASGKSPPRGIFFPSHDNSDCRNTLPQTKRSSNWVWPAKLAHVLDYDLYTMQVFWHVFFFLLNSWNSIRTEMAFWQTMTRTSPPTIWGRICYDFSPFYFLFGSHWESHLQMNCLLTVW